MATIEYLDVTKIEPRHKQPTIFRRFDELIPGESFVIDNDHDPKPLYYELLAERGNIFSWEYLMQGPERWQVKITLHQDKKASGENSEKDMQKAELLKQKGIEFNCGK